jgi:hypothetical protein
LLTLGNYGSRIYGLVSYDQRAVRHDSDHGTPRAFDAFDGASERYFCEREGSGHGVRPECPFPISHTSRSGALPEGAFLLGDEQRGLQRLLRRVGPGYSVPTRAKNASMDGSPQ